jgi:hypothetical protein
MMLVCSLGLSQLVWEQYCTSSIARVIFVVSTGSMSASFVKRLVGYCWFSQITEPKSYMWCLLHEFELHTSLLIGLKIVNAKEHMDADSQSQCWPELGDVKTCGCTWNWTPSCGLKSSRRNSTTDLLLFSLSSILPILLMINPTYPARITKTSRRNPHGRRQLTREHLGNAYVL